MGEQILILPHELLSASRKEAGIPVEKIAVELNLTVSVVQAVEEGRYDSLYGDAFVCGVLRSYAGLLGMDASSVVQAFKDSRPHPVVTIEEVEPGIIGAHLSLQHKKYHTGYGIAAVMMLVILLGVFSQKDEKIADQASDASIAIDTAIGTTIVSSLDEMPSVNPTQDILPEVVVVTPVAVSTTGLQSPDLLVSGKKDTETSQALSSLSFTFSADCWVEILDGNNEKIFASLQRAQQRLELTGKPPFRVTLGYAPGVALSYNSQPVPIDVDVSNVAKLVLGNS